LKPIDLMERESHKPDGMFRWVGAITVSWFLCNLAIVIHCLLNFVSSAINGKSSCFKSLLVWRWPVITVSSFRVVPYCCLHSWRRHRRAKGELRTADSDEAKWSSHHITVEQTKTTLSTQPQWPRWHRSYG
jgi:hypothetical protein